MSLHWTYKNQTPTLIQILFMHIGQKPIKFLKQLNLEHKKDAEISALALILPLHCWRVEVCGRTIENHCHFKEAPYRYGGRKCHRVP